MRKDIKELIQLVVEEATNLRDKLKEEERDNLNIETLSPKYGTKCVYGQISGDCLNDRAVSLIKKCCSRMCTSNTVLKGYNNLTGATINGSPKRLYRYSFWSPIEVFIAQKGNRGNGNNKMLIDFLKKKRKTLRFK